MISFRGIVDYHSEFTHRKHSELTVVIHYSVEVKSYMFDIVFRIFPHRRLDKVSNCKVGQKKLTN